MSTYKKQVDRTKVDWSKARCRGINTNIFFTEEESRYDKQINQTIIRRMCFSCPLQRECMEVGFDFEEFGSWGGISSLERRELRMKRYHSVLLNPLRKDLLNLGLEIKEVLGDRYKPADKLGNN